MTNILATITLVVVTNWVTAYTSRPPCSHEGCPVFHTEVEHQVGAVVTNAVATVVWQGRTNEFSLQSTQPTFFPFQRVLTNFNPKPYPSLTFTPPLWAPRYIELTNRTWITNLSIQTIPL